jgi:hypothetical protein
LDVWPAKTPSSPVLRGESKPKSRSPWNHPAQPDTDSIYRGIGLETAILFAKEGASVLLADISEPALEKALAKVKQLVPNAPRLEIRVRSTT